MKTQIKTLTLCAATLAAATVAGAYNRPGQERPNRKPAARRSQRLQLGQRRARCGRGPPRRRGRSARRREDRGCGPGRGRRRARRMRDLVPHGPHGHLVVGHGARARQQSDGQHADRHATPGAALPGDQIDFDRSFVHRVKAQESHAALTLPAGTGRYGCQVILLQVRSKRQGSHPRAIRPTDLRQRQDYLVPHQVPHQQDDRADAARGMRDRTVDWTLSTRMDLWR